MLLAKSCMATLMFIAVASAEAVPTLSFSFDGGAPIYCATGQACDIQSPDGASDIWFVGPIDPNLSRIDVFAQSGLLFNSRSLAMNVGFRSSGGSHDLVVGFSDIGFASPFRLAYFHPSGNGTNPTPFGTTMGTAYYDPSNQLFGQAISLGVAGENGYSTTLGDGMTAPYSLTMFYKISWIGPGEFLGGMFMLTEVPEPDGLALLSLGLAGLAFTRRRKH